MNRIVNSKLSWCVLIMILIGYARISNAFVERKYALREVINECTNIVFGTLTSVDRKKQRAIVKVEEDVKGKSNFGKIKINVAVGQHRGNLTSPEKFMKALRVGNPVIIFYKYHAGAIDALGHTSGTWFQTRTQVGNNPNAWWTFTHIEIYMHRTFKGSTEDFQQLLLMTLKPFEYAKLGDVKVLAFTKRRANNEFSALSSFRKIAGKNVVYKSTQVLKPSDLNKADILWIGYRSVSQIRSGKYLFDNETESRIKEFARRGGIVILSGQDSDPKRPCEVGFLPEPIKGVEGKVGNGIQFVQKDNLFTTPERIQADLIRVDDAWAGASKHYSVLAKTFEGKIAIAKLNYGAGTYIITAMQNGRPAHLKANAPLMKNLMYQAISLMH
ncbi:TPA: hypothetical protein EYP66_10865 [Candidatus Poribacteria bacterium]|nr:hypothetical protein [Candidatus Poribacteria bacterium]